MTDDTPVAETLFAQVVITHIAPLLDKTHLSYLRTARIAALRAELTALESSEADNTTTV